MEQTQVLFRAPQWEPTFKRIDLLLTL